MMRIPPFGLTAFNNPWMQIYVDPPIRQGQTSYPFFIMEIGSDDEVFDLPLNMPEYVNVYVRGLGRAANRIRAHSSDLTPTMIFQGGPDQVRRAG